MVQVYSSGICHCSVCVPKELTHEQIEEQVNLEHPTGINSKWRISKDKTFKGGEANPCACNYLPESNLHYLMEC